MCGTGVQRQSSKKPPPLGTQTCKLDRFIRKSSMGLPLLIFYDIFLSRSITRTETQTTSSCLCVTVTSLQHVWLPCASYLHIHVWEAELKESGMFLWSSLLFFQGYKCWLLWYAAQGPCSSILQSKHKEVMLCKSGMCEKEMWVHGLQPFRLLSVNRIFSPSQYHRSHFQVKTCP